MIQRQEVIKGTPKLVFERLEDMINSQFPKAKAVIEWNDKNFTGSGSVLEAEGSVVVEPLGNGSLVLVAVSIKGVSELVYSEARAAMVIDRILNQLKASFFVAFLLIWR